MVRFCAQLVAGDLGGAEAFVRELSAAGQDFDEIAEALLARASRRLGQQWDDDEISFVDVSLGVSTLFHLARLLDAESALSSSGDRGLAIFATLPDQAHTLGIVLAAEAFRQHDWSVDLRLSEDAPDIIDAVQRKQPVILGVTLSHADDAAGVAAVVAAAKALPQPPQVILGGAIAARRPQHIDAIRADWIVQTLAEANAAADRIDAARAPRPPSSP
ncbi:MAG: cobalamin-dependent protein [Pseudomonadota bacterium]